MVVDVLAAAADPDGGHVEVVIEDRIAAVASRANLVINASTRGQAGFFQRGKPFHFGVDVAYSF